MEITLQIQIQETQSKGASGFLKMFAQLNTTYLLPVRIASIYVLSLRNNFQKHWVYARCWSSPAPENKPVILTS